jgi:nucleoside phosphorylase
VGGIESFDSPDQIGEVDVLLVTVAKVEAQAVLSTVKEELGRDVRSLYVGDQTYYDLGEIGGARALMLRSEMGVSGPSGAISSILDAITDLSPSAVIMVGIAFGVDQGAQRIGDVLVSRQISYYEPQRVGTDANGKPAEKARGDRVSAAPRLLDRFRDGELRWTQSNVRVGLILSGEKLVDNLDFRSRLLQVEPEAIGGEMEGAGLYSAAYRKKVDWIVVKAICDWADGKKSDNKERNQQIAAQNAAAFTIFVMEQGGLTRSRRNLDRSDAIKKSGPQEQHTRQSFPMPKMRETFSDREKDEFLEIAFEFVKEYFRQALVELQTQAQVETSFREVHALKFVSRIYVQGKERSQCKIWLGGVGRGGSIYYAEQNFGIDTDNAYNDFIVVEDDGFEIYLKLSNMWLSSGLPRDAKASKEEVAEYLWRRFISRLEY